jgi:hypothetical protein
LTQLSRRLSIPSRGVHLHGMRKREELAHRANSARGF